MYHRTSISPLYQWLFDHGYTQTRLRKEYNYTGALTPLAKELLPQIMKDHVVNKMGRPVTRYEDVLYALHSIRNQRTKGTRGDRQRREAAQGLKPTRVIIRVPKIAPIPDPPPLTPIGELLKMMATRIPEAGRQLDETINWLNQTTREYEALRADLVAMQGLLRRAAVLPPGPMV